MKFLNSENFKKLKNPTCYPHKSMPQKRSMKNLMALLFLLTAVPATHAHDWYSSTTDPVFQSSCCGGHDCAPLNPEFVTIEKDGYRVRMTAEQSRTVNPSSSQPVDAFVPGSRVQSPPNGEHAFYACIYDVDRDPPRNGIICFFATPTM